MERSLSAHVQAILSKSHSDNGPEILCKRYLNMHWSALIGSDCLSVSVSVGYLVQINPIRKPQREKGYLLPT